MTQVIEGLKVTVVGKEVAELATKQANIHFERAAFYAQHVELHAGMQVGGSSLTTSHQDPKEAAKNKRQEHQDKAEHLIFIAGHVKPEAEYLLDSSALASLGVLKNYRGF